MHAVDFADDYGLQMGAVAHGDHEFFHVVVAFGGLGDGGA